jgi:hypothetical protein
VSIWSKHPLIDRVMVRDPIRTVAAIYDTALGKLLVYGTVMPCQPAQRHRGPNSAEWFQRRRPSGRCCASCTPMWRSAWRATST